MTRTNEGTFAVTSESPHGPTTYKFSGKDLTGNRGNAQGAGITIDVQGPEASIESPVTVLQITADPVPVSLVLNEASVTAPSLDLKATNGAMSPLNGLTTTDNGVHWTRPPGDCTCCGSPLP